MEPIFQGVLCTCVFMGSRVTCKQAVHIEFDLDLISSELLGEETCQELRNLEPWICKNHKTPLGFSTFS